MEAGIKKIKITWKTDKVKFLNAELIDETPHVFIVRPLGDTRVFEISKSAVIELQRLDGWGENE